MSKRDKSRSPQKSVSHVPDGPLSERSVSGRQDHVSIDERIRLRAYELYLERGREPNRDLGDWLQAEREFRGQSDAGPTSRYDPPFTVTGQVTAPKFGAAGSGGLEYELLPEAHGQGRG